MAYVTPRQAALSNNIGDFIWITRPKNAYDPLVATATDMGVDPNRELAAPGQTPANLINAVAKVQTSTAVPGWYPGDPGGYPTDSLGRKTVKNWQGSNSREWGVDGAVPGCCPDYIAVLTKDAGTSGDPAAGNAYTTARTINLDPGWMMNMWDGPNADQINLNSGSPEANVDLDSDFQESASTWLPGYGGTSRDVTLWQDLPEFGIFNKTPSVLEGLGAGGGKSDVGVFLKQMAVVAAGVFIFGKLFGSGRKAK